jgi:hypothetical protein
MFVGVNDAVITDVPTPTIVTAPVAELTVATEVVADE